LIRSLALATLFTAFVAHAADDRRAAIVARALSYDYALKSRAGEGLSIGVVYRPVTTEAAADQWVQSFKPLESVKVQGMAINVAKIAYEGIDRLKSRVSAEGIDVLIVCDGLDDALSAILQLSHEKKLLTVAGKEAYVQGGVTLGIVNEGERITIEVNVAGAAAEGVNFSSELLRLAKMIK